LRNLRLSIEATNDRAWVVDENKYELGELTAGKRIYFAVDRGVNDNYYYDATEISWTVTKSDAATGFQPENAVNNLPEKFALGQNYPNPFNLSTKMDFQLPIDSEISLDIFNIQGQKICTLEKGFYKAGYHSTNWNGKNQIHIDVSSGIYITRMVANSNAYNQKLILLR